MIFLISFLVFVFFVVAMSLGMILKRKPLQTEDEATAAILDEIACASCTIGSCSYAGSHKNYASSRNCAGKDSPGQQSIPHKVV